jgi:hypothetical protein
MRFPPYAVKRGAAVQVDFCFLIQNPDLIGSRRFITHAHIQPLAPHAPVLASDSCPKLGAGYIEKLDSPDFRAELTEKLKNNPGSAIPIEFEGILYRPPLVRHLWFRFAENFGLRDHTPPITITAYKMVGN